VTSDTKRKALASREDLHLQNRFCAVIANHRLGALLNEVSEPTDHEPHRAPEKGVLLMESAP